MVIFKAIVPVSRQRNGRAENAAIKAGETPEGWDDQPARRRQKDTATPAGQRSTATRTTATRTTSTSTGGTS